MLFSSLIFIFLFLPLVLLAYFISPKFIKNYVLLFFSLIFYAWGEPKFIIAMLLSITLNYFFALLISKYEGRNNLRKSFLILSVFFNLGLMFIFKYLNFTISNINTLFGMEIFAQTYILLPIGISFFTFQAMSYVIDVYKGNVKVQRNPFYVAMYISLFPQLIAGPIVRYSTIEKQITSRTVTLEGFSEGVRRFIVGLSKKVLLANTLAIVADNVFSMDPGSLSLLLAWTGAIAYTFQIFFDFSGYSDMAIGLGLMFGFHFLENFNFPYTARSITDFWRRWHISLSSWFRDYVYFPLGGSRVNSKQRLILNLFVVWLLTGVWHGASWNFIVWGLFYFVILTIEKLTGIPDKFNSVIATRTYRLVTLVSIVIAWVIFRAPDLGYSIQYIKSMLLLNSNQLTDDLSIFYLSENWFFFFAALLFSTKLPQEFSMYSTAKVSAATLSIIFIVSYTLMFLISTSYLVLGTHNPFIYFNF